jgi:ATP/maltotriose-dependent transcriptional regulator MalT
LRSAWEQCDPSADAGLAAVIAQRRALHSVGRLFGAEVMSWAERALELAPPGAPVRGEADNLLGLGFGWAGRLEEGLALYEAVLVRSSGLSAGAPLSRVQMPLGWLRLIADDVSGARATLADAAPDQLRRGSLRVAVWAYVWLSRAEFLLGSWDRATVAAERAVTLLEESGHEWLRPLARWAAMAVPAARGDWRAAEEHVRLAATQAGDYELMIVAGGLARAQLAAARGDQEAVLRALEPVVAIGPRDGVDEPGFWPWQYLYGEALVSTGRLEEAAQFLAPHEELAAARGRRSSIAMLAAVRGRLEAAQGHPEAATAAFQHGLEQLEELPLPFNQALLSLAYGQLLRRQGHRRAAAEQLHAAHSRFSELGAQPYLDLCERELSASGLTPAKRNTFDPSQLTAQELAVARLVAGGMSNRQVASELFVSIKTVQFHLTHIYTKLRISSRAELAAVFPVAKRGDDDAIHECRHTSSGRSGGRAGLLEPIVQPH